MRFFIVDVFGIDKYSGNQLAVVMPDEYLSKDAMQEIANEFHFSETTFISPENKTDYQYKVNIFTPFEEVPFAGHPTLGTAFVIKNEILKDNTAEIILDLEAGKIPVTSGENGLLWMKQNEPIFGKIRKPEEIAPVLNLSVEQLDTRFPVMNVSTGMEFIIIPLKDLAAIRSANMNLSKYKKYFKDKPELLYMFCPETYGAENKLNCRMFADVFGIPEDPATGSAAGCLAAYLFKHKYLENNHVDISIEQGFEINRKSILYLKAFEEKGKIIIKIGGKVFKIAEGNLV